MTLSIKYGKCLCGETTFEYTGPENWCGHCHCESCRRNTSSPFTTFIGVPREVCRFTGKTPATYHSSPGVSRLFCSHCGSPIAYDSDRYPSEIHFYVACMENPDPYVPQLHVHCNEQLPWIKIADDLPRYPGVPNKNG